MGRADEVQAYFENVPSYARDSYWAAFAQDDFKVTRKLTLNLVLPFGITVTYFRSGVKLPG